MKPIKNVKTHSFTTGIKSEIANDFKNISAELGKNPSQLLREFIVATVENRVKISPKITKNYKNLYTQ